MNKKKPIVDINKTDIINNKNDFVTGRANFLYEERSALNKIKGIEMGTRISEIDMAILLSKKMKLSKKPVP